MAEQPKKVTVQRRTYKGKEYLVTKEGKVYDPDTREEQDDLFWNAEFKGFQEVEHTTYGLDEDNFKNKKIYNTFLKNLDFEIDEEPENGFRRIYDDDEGVISFIKETDIAEDDVIRDINDMGITIEKFKIKHPYTEPKVKDKPDIRTVTVTRPETVVDIEIPVFIGYHPSKEEGRPNILLYPVFWSGEITAVDVETRDWSRETELDITEPVGYIALDVKQDLNNQNIDERFKDILLGFFDDFDDDYTIQMLQHPAKLYNDIDKTFIQTLGFDLPKMRINNKEQVWEVAEPEEQVAVATPEPVVQEKKAVVTTVVNLPETKEVLQDKLEVHPTFGLVRKITPFRPTGTPKEKKEQTKREMKTLKPILQKLLDEVGDMETELVRLEGIIGGLNRRFNETATEYERVSKTTKPKDRSGQDKALKAEMYRIKEELKPYEIQFDALEQKFQADRIIASTEELKFDELEKLYATFKEGKGIDNPDLYKKAKELADATYSKPSAFKSGFIVKKYKELGGTYSGQKGYKGIGRWFKEEWKDVGNKEYPVFRPTKRVTKDTPLTPDEIDPANLKKQIALKQIIKGDANLPAFKIKEGGALKGLDPNKKTEILKFSDPKKAIKNAIQYLKDNIVFGLSTKKTKKYMVQRPDGKWIHFGEMGYEDFTKHQDDKRRQNYLKRTANMKGNWKDDKYSANNLARNILW